MRKFLISGAGGVTLVAIAGVVMVQGCFQEPEQQARKAEQIQHVLQMSGSTTIGNELMPAMVRGFFASISADTVYEAAAEDTPEKQIVAHIGQRRIAIDISSYGSGTGFDDLAWGKCEIAMSSMPVDPISRQKLVKLGDMTSADCEHVVGLDGVAVIVNHTNPLDHISIENLSAIYSGQITDWSSISSTKHGAIRVYSRDHSSGTFEIFMHRVMTEKKLRGDVIIARGNPEVSLLVEQDPDAIGYVGLGAVGPNKALAVSAEGGLAVAPAKFNIATEDYPLSRRLYLYIPAYARKKLTMRLIEFAASPEGQAIVERSGLVSQQIRFSSPSGVSGPQAYQVATHGALRISLAFRFMYGSSMLDSKGLSDLDRLANFIDSEQFGNCALVLLGFADNVGDQAYNMWLSQQRAQVVRDQLSQRMKSLHIDISGMGDMMPVAPNSTAEGRQRNRRVEAWLRCAEGSPEHQVLRTP